ncbi:MAG: hypothetical protein WBB23_11300, partial [Desulforhopalus sp.]
IIWKKSRGQRPGYKNGNKNPADIDADIETKNTKQCDVIGKHILLRFTAQASHMACGGLLAFR